MQAFAGATPYHLLVSPPPGRAWSYDTSGGQPGWWWRFLHRGERERGLECVEDLYGVGDGGVRAGPGGSLQLTATIEGRPGSALAPGAAPPAPRPDEEGDEFLAQTQAGRGTVPRRPPAPG